MRFELEKLLKNKIIWVLVAVSAVVTIYFSVERFRYVKEYKDAEISEYEGLYSEELVERINAQCTQIHEELTQINVGGALSKISNEAPAYEEDTETESRKEELEQELLRWVIVEGKANSYRRAMEYRHKVVKNAGAIKTSQDAYQRRLGEQIEKRYGKKVALVIKNEELSANISKKWREIEYADYINLLCIIVMVCAAFINEHTSNVYKMIYSSYHGRGKNYFTKILAIVLGVIGMAVVTTLLQLAPSFGHRDFVAVMKLDIQNLLIHSPFSAKLYQLWFWIMLLRMLGYVTIAMCMVFLTQFFRKNALPFCVGSVLFLGGFAFVSNLINRIELLKSQSAYYRIEQKRLGIFEKYTPFGLIRSGESFFSEYEPNNILDYPVTNLTITVALNIFYIIVFAYAGYFVYQYRFRNKGEG